MNVKLNDILKNDYLKKYSIVDWGYTEESRPVYIKEFKKWVDSKKNLPLSFLSGEGAEKREDINNFFPEFQSALVFLFSYQKTHNYLSRFYQTKESNSFKIASFTLGFEGGDYHQVVRNHLNQIGQDIQKEIPGIVSVHSLDIQPVLERDLAYRSGLGWFGKNSCLINKDHGSFFILGALLLSGKLDISAKEKADDLCGSCTKCIDACPTKAIDPTTKTIVVRRCVSNFTIETFKDDCEPPSGYLDGKYIFGCDICQAVCPWNKLSEEKTISLNEKGKLIFEKILSMPPGQLASYLESISNREFKRIFKGTSFERTGRVGLLKNISPHFKSN